VQLFRSSRSVLRTDKTLVDCQTSIVASHLEKHLSRHADTDLSNDAEIRSLVAPLVVR
jgi:hypothetical protein